MKGILFRNRLQRPSCHQQQICGGDRFFPDLFITTFASGQRRESTKVLSRKIVPQLYALFCFAVLHSVARAADWKSRNPEVPTDNEAAAL